MEVEEAITSHPDVRACAAFAADHDVLQEVVGIVIVPETAGPRSLDLPTLHAYIAEKLATPKWPQCLVFMEDGLPKSHTNKLLRVKLGSRLGLPEFSDTMSYWERTFEAKVSDGATLRCIVAFAGPVVEGRTHNQNFPSLLCPRNLKTPVSRARGTADGPHPLAARGYRSSLRGKDSSECDKVAGSLGRPSPSTPGGPRCSRWKGPDTQGTDPNCHRQASPVRGPDPYLRRRQEETGGDGRRTCQNQPQSERCRGVHLERELRKWCSRRGRPVRFPGARHLPGTPRIGLYSSPRR